MRKILASVVLTLAFGIPASAQFDFRTTGTRAARVLEITCTPTSAPAVSAANMGKIFVPCSGISGYSAGNIYISQNTGPWTLLSSFVGSGAVSSVFGRTGSITAQESDYATWYSSTSGTESISGAWTFSGAVALGASATASTPASTDNDTSVATTAFVQSETISASETATLTNKTISGASNTLSNIAQASITNLTSDLALKAPLASPALTGTPTTPTAAASTNTTQIASTAFVQSESLNSTEADALFLTPAEGNAAYVALTGSQTIAGNKNHTNGLFERGYTSAAGIWTPVAYSAANFSTDTGTWTVESGDIIFLRWMVIGKTMWLSGAISTTTVSGSPNHLRIAVPGGFTPINLGGSNVLPVSRFLDNGVDVEGMALPFGTNLLLQKRSGTWGNSTNNTRVEFAVCFELQ